MITPQDAITELLTYTSSFVKPGVSTMTLNNLAEAKMDELGVAAYNKGYFPKWASARYPYATCISVNDEIAHGIPSEYVLKEGDLVNIDLGVKVDGRCGDAALSLPVGKVSEKNQKLLHYAKKALYAGIDKVASDVAVWEIAKAIEEVAGWGGFVVNRQLVGHGIGKEMHEEPYIYHVMNHYVQAADQWKSFDDIAQVKLKAGQIICLEPQLTFKDRWGVRQDNEYTFKTSDGLPSAFFEHMVLVKDDGYEILTKHIQPFKLAV
jgi:methionyl aminopeptidase